MSLSQNIILPYYCDCFLCIYFNVDPYILQITLPLSNCFHLIKPCYENHELCIVLFFNITCMYQGDLLVWL